MLDRVRGELFAVAQSPAPTPVFDREDRHVVLPGDSRPQEAGPDSQEPVFRSQVPRVPPALASRRSAARRSNERTSVGSSSGQTSNCTVPSAAGYQRLRVAQVAGVFRLRRVQTSAERGRTSPIFSPLLNPYGDAVESLPPVNPAQPARAPRPETASSCRRFRPVGYGSIVTESTVASASSVTATVPPGVGASTVTAQGSRSRTVTRSASVTMGSPQRCVAVTSMPRVTS